MCGFATVSAATGVRHRDANQVGKGTPAVKGSLGVHVDRVSLDAGYLGTNETAAEEAVARYWSFGLVVGAASSPSLGLVLRC